MMQCKIIESYKEKNVEIEQALEETPLRVKHYLQAFFFSLFAVSAPILVLVNLLIFVDYLKLTIYGICLCFVGQYILFRKFQLDAVCDVKKTYKVYLIEGSIFLILLTVLYLLSTIWW